MAISVIILTFNAEATIGATLAAAARVSDDLHVVDSGSTDRTLEIVRGFTDAIIRHPFESYGAQRNWAMDAAATRHDWQLHLDADERLSEPLIEQLNQLSASGFAGAAVGYFIPRLVHFLGAPIRHGGMYPIWHMRLFRRGRGRCETRRYDQHFFVDGPTGRVDAPMIDDIRMPLAEWTIRHNRWAEAEADAMQSGHAGEGVAARYDGDPVEQKRALRRGYDRAPPLLRAFLLFFYRYVLRLGFLDGRAGLIFFALQTFWFRFLVDAKLYERALARRALAAPETCLVCGGALHETLDGVFDTRFGAPDAYNIARCAVCGLEQTLPRPAAAELGRLYARYYNFGGESGTAYTGLRQRFFASGLYRLWMALDGDISFHNRRNRIDPAQGRLLDIGCNEGRGLALYRARGFAEVEGLETNPDVAAAARGRGFAIHEVELATFQPGRPFDVAVLSNVLEHALDPVAMLREVRRILQPGGEVWISCPNARSWARRLFGRGWINWHVPFHISHFDAATLRDVASRAGFAPVAAKQITPALWLAHSVIATLFATPGQPTRELRRPPLVLGLMAAARGLLFPLLWLGDRAGRGDCLTLIARRS